MKRFLHVLSLVALLSVTSWAGTIVLQQELDGYNGVQDTYSDGLLDSWTDTVHHHEPQIKTNNM